MSSSKKQGGDKSTNSGGTNNKGSSSSSIKSAKNSKYKPYSKGQGPNLADHLKVYQNIHRNYGEKTAKNPTSDQIKKSVNTVEKEMGRRLKIGNSRFDIEKNHS